MTIIQHARSDIQTQMCQMASFNTFLGLPEVNSVYYNNKQTIIQTISSKGSLLKLVSSGLMAPCEQSEGAREMVGGETAPPQVMGS